MLVVNMPEAPIYDKLAHVLIRAVAEELLMLRYVQGRRMYSGSWEAESGRFDQRGRLHAGIPGPASTVRDSAAVIRSPGSARHLANSGE